MYEKIRKWFKQGLWSAEKINNAVVKGLLIQEQANLIIGEVE